MRSYLNKIIIILILLIVCGCTILNRNEEEQESRYTYLVDMLREHGNYSDSSAYFDIDAEMAKINDGYRYYIIIDNPKLAMYDIEVIAIEPGVDYKSRMAANIGIFEETQYHMIPNQSNAREGYVKGLVASGVSDNPEAVLHVFVQFKNFDYSIVYTEYIELNCSYEDQ